MNNEHEREVTLYHYRVSLKEDEGDKFMLVFYCWAEDVDHAEEQAENAHPGCMIVNTIQV